jgi:creatinine amidohydrolase
VELASATWTDVDRAARRLLVVPLGSLEQHGPHLPMDTDLRVAAAVARRACAGRDGVALAPGVPIGASGEHADFPGTLSVGTDALTAYLVELGRHAARDWPALLLANAHGGNGPAVRAAVARLTYEGRRAHAWHAAVPGGDAHAGRTETSLMLAIAPETVRTTAAEPGNTAPAADLMPAMRAGGVRAVSPNGVLGDPAGATEDEGERLLAAMTARLGAVVERVLAGTHDQC